MKKLKHDYNKKMQRDILNIYLHTFMYPYVAFAYV